MVGAILVVPEEDLYLDYEFTSLSTYRRVQGRSGEGMQGLLKGLEPYGENINQRAENFLHTQGVTDEMMEKIRAILLEN